MAGLGILSIVLLFHGFFQTLPHSASSSEPGTTLPGGRIDVHAVEIPSVEFAAFKSTYRLEDTDLNAADGTGGIASEVARL